MSVTKRGSFADLKREARRAQQRGMREFTREVFTNVRKRTPKRTGRLARSWESSVRGTTGTVGNTSPYAAEVALGPKNRRATAKERKNIGFHERAVTRSLKRIDRLYRRAFQRIFG